MRYFLFCTLLMLLIFNRLFSQENKSEPKYSMQKYYFVFLKTGPNGNDTTGNSEIFKGHMAHIKEMAASGKLKLAGPFADAGDLEGFFIFDVSTPDEAQKLCDEDPAVKSGKLVTEIVQWYGPKGLTVIPDKQ